MTSPRSERSDPSKCKERLGSRTFEGEGGPEQRSVTLIGSSGITVRLGRGLGNLRVIFLIDETGVVTVNGP